MPRRISQNEMIDYGRSTKELRNSPGVQAKMEEIDFVRYKGTQKLPGVQAKMKKRIIEGTTMIEY